MSNSRSKEYSYLCLITKTSFVTILYRTGSQLIACARRTRRVIWECKTLLWQLDNAPAYIAVCVRQFLSGGKKLKHWASLIIILTFLAPRDFRQLSKLKRTVLVFLKDCISWYGRNLRPVTGIFRVIRKVLSLDSLLSFKWFYRLKNRQDIKLTYYHQKL